MEAPRFRESGKDFSRKQAGDAAVLQPPRQSLPAQGRLKPTRAMTVRPGCG